MLIQKSKQKKFQKKKKKKNCFFFLQRGNTINLKEHKVYNRIGIVEHKISTAIEWAIKKLFNNFRHKI
jgi:hypothetical protein